MIKAIFFDIDGTLLSHRTRTIPQSTQIALKRLRERGIYTFIATGRHISEMKDLPLDNLEFDGYITLNGQYCYNKNEVIYDLPIDQQDIHNIIQLIENDSFPCIFVEKELMYINYHNQAVQIVQDAISTPLPDINDLKRGYDNPIYQVIPYDITQDDEAKILEAMPHCKKTRWHDLAIDVIPSQGGKQNGILKVLDYYNISIDETMAFGDGHNDIEMLSLAGIGVCMENGHEDVKLVSDFITKSVYDDGIVYALEYFNMI